MSKTQAGTLHDVARISGLSIATISKYLNGVHVKAENKRKIEHAISACNYNVNFFARSLKTGFSMTIGVLVPNIASAFYSSLMAETERRMTAKGYTLYVSGYDNNAAQENAKFRALISRKTDVILIAPEKLSEESLEIARANKIPVLFFDTALEDADVCAVVTDNRAVCRDVTRELLDRGFENIAVLAPGSLYSTTNDRCFGVRDAVEETGKNCVTIIHDLGCQLLRADAKASQRKPSRCDLRVVFGYVPGRVDGGGRGRLAHSRRRGVYRVRQQPAFADVYAPFEPCLSAVSADCRGDLRKIARVCGGGGVRRKGGREVARDLHRFDCEYEKINVRIPRFGRGRKFLTKKLNVSLFAEIRQKRRFGI